MEGKTTSLIEQRVLAWTQRKTHWSPLEEEASNLGGSTARKKRRLKENLHPLLDSEGITVTKNEEKASMLNAFFSQSLRERCIILRVLSPLSWKIRMGSRSKSPQTKRKRSVTCYTSKTYTSLKGWGRSIQQYWGSWWKCLTRHFLSFISSPGWLGHPSWLDFGKCDLYVQERLWEGSRELQACKTDLSTRKGHGADYNQALV